MTASNPTDPVADEFAMEELILRKLSGAANDLDLRRVEHWRTESPENERRYLELEMIWKATVPAPVGAAPSSASIVVEADSRAEFETRRGHVARLLDPGSRGWLAIAAVIATVALGVSFQWSERAEAVPEGVEFLASSGTQTMPLPDGSLVRLAPEARIRFVAGADAREVWLTGRAFFGVTHKEGQPFVVHTDRGSTRVLGTRFEVAEETSELRVIVVEGRVRVEVAGGSQLDVPSGQIARIDADGDLSVESVDDVFDYLDWDGGLLMFQETPLAQVAREIGRHFGTEVTIADSSLNARSITAWFSDESRAEVVDAICLIIGATCSSDSAGVILGAR